GRDRRHHGRGPGRRPSFDSGPRRARPLTAGPAVPSPEPGNAPGKTLKPGGAVMAQDTQPTRDMATRSRADGDDARSTPELIKAVAGDTATLVRKEVELARQEIVEALAARAKAAGALGAAGAMGLFAFLFLAVAGALA